MSRDRVWPQSVLQVADNAARNIIAWFDQLTPSMRWAVSYNLINDEYCILNSVGEALQHRNISTLGDSLVFCAFLGEAEQMIGLLSDEGPWGVIRTSLSDVLEALFEARPSYRAQHAMRQRQIARAATYPPVIDDEDDDE